MGDWPKRLQRSLVAGFLIVGPLAISVFLLIWSVSALDGLLAPLAAALLGRRVPGLGLALALLLLLGVGSLASNLMGRHLLELAEEFLLRIPVFSALYRTVKQVTEVFSPAGKSQFRSVVLVEYPRPDVYSLGFVTNQVALSSETGSEPFCCVYIPTNHLYIGDILLVPKARVRETSLTLQQGVQAILSAGASVPDPIKLGALKTPASRKGQETP